MNQNELLEEQYELFEGDLRKLGELIGQLELWSDEYTINHKKEEVRLPQYVELHLNLETLKEELNSFLEAHKQDEGQSERLASYQSEVEAKLAAYKPTEENIHNWIRAIKNVRTMIVNIPVLKENEAFIEGILS